jgi:hypothetical protein
MVDAVNHDIGRGDVVRRLCRPGSNADARTDGRPDPRRNGDYARDAQHNSDARSFCDAR